MDLPTLRWASSAGRLGAALLLSSCAAPAAENEASGSLPNAETAEVAAIERTLALGMSGDDVTVLHRLLANYGYLPNERLARQFPAWRPIVAQAPADERTFDEHTLQAVEAYQRNSGLPVTGEFDEATRSQFGARACGTPDGIVPVQADDKASVMALWGKRAFKWRLLNHDGVDLDIWTTAALIAGAFDAWAAESNLTFTLTSADDATADFALEFAPIDGFNTGFKARAANNVVTFDLNERWVATAGPTDGSSDLYRWALHEIGHLLGVGHSSHYAIMHNEAVSGRTLTWDDRGVISIMYDTFDQIDSSAAVDVATFPQQDGASTVFFAMSDGRVRTNGTGPWESLTLPSGARAQRIAMGGDGVPWVVDHQNRVWCRRNIVVGSWTQKLGCLRDIGIDAQNRMWGINCSGQPVQWTATQRCNSDSTNPWRAARTLPAGEIGTSIAVNHAGHPIVVTQSNKILRRQSTSWDGLEEWLEMPVFNQGPGRAIDVAANSLGHIWVVGLDNGFYLYNEQQCWLATTSWPCPTGVVNPWDHIPGDNGAPFQQGWGRSIEGLGTRIASGGDGLVVIGMDGRVWRTRR